MGRERVWPPTSRTPASALLSSLAMDIVPWRPIQGQGLVLMPHDSPLADSVSMCPVTREDGEESEQLWVLGGCCMTVRGCQALLAPEWTSVLGCTRPGMHHHRARFPVQFRTMTLPWHASPSSTAYSPGSDTARRRWG